MKTFTEEQVKELLAQQRENCLLAWANSETDRDTLISLANALEPPLHSLVEQEPIGYVKKDNLFVDWRRGTILSKEYFNKFCDQNKEGFKPVYAQPQITWPDEEQADKWAIERYGNDPFSFGGQRDGFREACKILKTKLGK